MQAESFNGRARGARATNVKVQTDQIQHGGENDGEGLDYVTMFTVKG